MRIGQLHALSYIRAMKVKLVPYDHQWPTQFEALKEELTACIAHLHPVIEHIGSTAVPGLMAKPTIDIQLGMPGKDELEALHDCLIPKGFTRNSRWDEAVPFRRFFLKLEQQTGGPEVPDHVDRHFKGDVRTKFISISNIHCTEISHEWFRNHLLFRDYLRSHPADRDAYQAVKLELAEKNWDITADYAEAKDVIIDQIKEKMNQWQRE